MGYAIRNDKKGARSVSGPDEVGNDEYFSDTPFYESADEISVTTLRAAMQAHMDQAAKAAGYDDIKSAVTYAEEPAVPKFQKEGRALRAWRSMVWAYGYEQIAAVQAGLRAQPSAEELIAELPVLVMP